MRDRVRIEGIVAVLPSFFDEGGEVDERAMTYFAEFLISRGIQGILVLGSNGECPYIREEDRKKIVEMVVETCAGRVPVVVGINERGLDDALEMTIHAEKAGADAALVALHRFYPLSEREVLDFYRELATSTKIPLLYYNFPSHTGIELSPEAIASMAAEGWITGAKETIFDMEEIGRLAQLTDEGFCTLTGTTLNLTEAMAVGACGAICPIPNIIPETSVDLFRALRAEEWKKASELQDEVRTLAPLLASPSPHAMIKEALRLLGHPVKTVVKKPLPSIDEGMSTKVKETLQRSGLM